MIDPTTRRERDDAVNEAAQATIEAIHHEMTIALATTVCNMIDVCDQVQQLRWSHSDQGDWLALEEVRCPHRQAALPNDCPLYYDTPEDLDYSWNLYSAHDVYLTEDLGLEADDDGQGYTLDVPAYRANHTE